MAFKQKSPNMREIPPASLPALNTRENQFAILMNTPRILLTSVAALLLPLTAKVHAQLVIDPTMTFVQEGGFVGAGNLGTTGTAFALDVYPFAPATHSIPHLNDGFFGNGNSWLDDINGLGSYAGIGFGSAQTIASFAFGRDNLGTFGDRAVGLYTIQFTADADLGTATWNTIGTINMDLGTGVTSPALRHRFNLVTPVSATGFRLLTPDGNAIDELELFATAGTPNRLEINSAPGFTVTWDGNDGDHFNPANPAPVPRNLATTATAFTSSDYGPALGIPYHRVINVNDGLYGNANSWIALPSDANPTAGVAFTTCWSAPS